MKSTLEHKRHSLAHLLAAAVQELYPGTRNTIGPAVDTGFYYDFEFKKPLAETELEAIEKKMKEILPHWEGFAHREVTEKEAREIFKDNPYKLELIDEIVSKNEPITLYTSGSGSHEFTDLCRGGHVSHMNKEIPEDSFKLERIAGAYWRGNEKNAMLTRIYGLAFETKKDLDAYIAQRNEAHERDHKKIGKEMGLFVFSPLVGSGLPLWTPKGTLIREALNDYVWELRKARGYKKVTIPHITKKDLYETSGHWKKFSEELFKIETREGKVYALKPMNCPHHTQIYDAEPRSYRDMPQRYCETTMVYRDEQSGELSGLSRVLSISQDDAHVFCRKNQIKDEVFAIWDIIATFYETIGLDNDLRVRISRHDPKEFGRYLGTPEIWKEAESQLIDLVNERGISDYIDGLGEAAMYGPKIDFIAKDSLGRTLQVATIQLDFNMPKNFGLTCINEEGKKEDIVMIHCAIMGSIERFMATLIEHTAGNFPVWLSPVQLAVIPVSDKHAEMALQIASALKKSDIRVDVHTSNEGLGKKIRQVKMDKVPYWIVVGDKEAASGIYALESRGGKKIEGQSIEAIQSHLLQEIGERRS